MGDPIEAVEELFQGLLGGTKLTMKDLEKAKRIFEKKNKRAKREIKREKGRNERLQEAISLKNEEMKREEERNEIAKQRESDRHHHRTKSIVEDVNGHKAQTLLNQVEIEELEKDIEENNEWLEKIQAAIDDFPSQA